MQVGPSLHRSARIRATVFGVWSLRILDVVEPFLLIDRTCRIVTVRVRGLVAQDSRCFQQIAEFIDSALRPLSRDVLNPARVPL